MIISKNYDSHFRAISFVGGDAAGRHIYNRGSNNGKRVQSNMGAKNHGVIMPDANKEYTINQLVGAAFGAAGQRCMALTTAVVVGEAKEWIPEVAARASKLVVTAGYSESQINEYIARAHKMSSSKFNLKCMTVVMLPHWSAQKESCLDVRSFKGLNMIYENTSKYYCS